MASVVSIKIVVDNAGALPAIDQINQGLASVGVKGTASFAQASAGADKMTGHISTGLDSVRLLSQEFGLRLPRAIEAMLSRMPAVTNALSGMLGIMAGIVAAQVFVHVAEEVYNAYEKYISLNAEADKFYETLKKTSQEDIVNTRSLETTRRRQDEATVTASRSPAMARTIQSSGIGSLLSGDLGGQIAGIAQITAAHSVASDGVTAAADMIKLGKVDLDQAHARALAQIDLNHAMDSTLGAAGKISAEAQKKRQIDAENRSFDRKQEMYYGNVSPADAGAGEQKMKDAQAAAEAAAAMTLLDRKERDERITAQNSAINSGLEGEARYRAEVEQSIAAITQKFHDGEISKQTFLSETASAQLKADNERLLRTQKLQEEARLTHRQTTLDGLDPAPRIRQEESNSIADINDQQQKMSGGKTLPLDVQTAFASKRADAHAAATQKMQAFDDAYAEHSQSLQASIAVSEEQSFAKIEAERQKQVLDEDKDFAKRSSQNEADKKLHQANLAAIDQDAATKKTQLAQRIDEENLRYDQQAAEAEKRVRANGIMGWVNSYKDGIAEIQAKDDEQTKKLQDQLASRQIDDQTYSRRKADVDAEANSNIAEQNQQMQQKIAGDLQQAFTNPVEFIKSAMEKMFFEIVAGWIVRMNVFKNLFGQTMGGLAPGAPGASGGVAGAGGIAGTLANAIPGMRGIVNGKPNISSVYTSAGSPAATSASGGGGFGASSSTGSAATGVLSSAHSSNASISAIMGDARSASSTLGHIPGFSAGSGSATPQPLSLPSAASTTNPSGGFGAALGDFHSATSTLSQIPSFGNSSNGLGTIPGTRGIVNGTATNPGDDPYTAGISDAQAQAAINTGTIGPQSGGGLQQGLGTAAMIGGAGYSAEQTTVKAFESGNPLQGALGDAAAGAEIGSLAGPMGTLIGAGVGAAVGASAGLIGMVSGEGSNLGARDYYEKSVLPTLEGDLNNPSMDYQSAVSDVSKTASDGMAYMTAHFGRSAADWVNANYLTKETQIVLKRIEDEAAGGRQYLAKSAVQFHTGGTISGFGDLATSSNEGFIHAMMGETVMNPAASMTHAPVLNAMQGGASQSDVASMYLAGSKPSSSPAQTQGDTNHHYNINALDSASFDSFLKNGNDRVMAKRLNSYNSKYAGDGISG